MATYDRPIKYYVAHDLRDAATFARQREELGGLVPFWPAQLADATIGGRRAIITRLRQQLKNLRQRALDNDWTYYLSVHVGVLQHYKIEMAEFNLLLRRARVEKRLRAA